MRILDGLGRPGGYKRCDRGQGVQSKRRLGFRPRFGGNMDHAILLLIAGVALAGVIAQWLGWRLSCAVDPGAAGLWSRERSCLRMGQAIAHPRRGHEPPPSAWRWRSSSSKAG